MKCGFKILWHKTLIHCNSSIHFTFIDMAMAAYLKYFTTKIKSITLHFIIIVIVIALACIQLNMAEQKWNKKNARKESILDIPEKLNSIRECYVTTKGRARRRICHDKFICVQWTPTFCVPRTTIHTKNCSAMMKYLPKYSIKMEWMQ